LNGVRNKELLPPDIKLDDGGEGDEERAKQKQKHELSRGNSKVKRKRRGEVFITLNLRSLIKNT
jgi:hypothetical protein